MDGKRSKTNVDWDIRFFRRYPREIRFTLKIKDRVYEVRTVDYCLIGVGIIINDPDVPLNKGDLVALDINELDLHQKTKVAWVVKGPSGIRVGLHRIKPLKGRFNIYPLPDILIGLQRTLRTGALEVRYRSLKKKLFIKSGNIIFAESNHVKDRLVDVLLKSRKISRKQYDKAEEMKRKSGKTHADILLHMGYIKPQDLIAALELQAKRILKSLFLMKDAEFELMEGLLSPVDPITLNLSVADFAYREVKKNADVELLESYLLDSVVDFSPDPLNLFQQIHFTTFDKAVISCVDGKRSIREIISLSTSAHRANPLKIIYALLETRFLKISGKHEPPTGIDADDIFGSEKVKAGPLSDEIEDLYSKYQDLDYYGILGVSHSSTAEEIKRAYYNAAKKYHPDKHLHLQTDAKTKLTEIFTYITNAYLTLTNEQRRKDYENTQKSPASQKPGMTAGQKDFQQKDHDPETQTRQAKQRFRDGKTAFWDKQFDAAARLFAAAIYFDQSVPTYHYFYGAALLALGSPKKAVQALNKADELNPLNADILAELGHAYLELDFSLRAKGYFNKALKLDPSNKRATEGIQMLRRK